MTARTKLVLAAVTGVALAGLATWLWLRPPPATETYREQPVTRGSIEITIQSTGTVKPRNRLEIKPPLAGRAEEVLVNEGQAVHRGQVLAWMSSSERAALLDAARAKGPDETKRWEEFYRPTPIIAPIDGSVILRNVEPGQSFTSNDAVLVVADRLIVEAQVDETDIAQVRLRQAARIVLDAYPDDPIPAQVEAIAYEAKTVNNVTIYNVDVVPARTPAFLRSGMTTSVYFTVAAKQGTPLLPARALRTRKGESYVLVKGADGRPAERPVKTGLSDGKVVEVLDGVSESDTVLIAQPAKAAKDKGGTNPFSAFGPKREKRNSKRE